MHFKCRIINLSENIKLINKCTIYLCDLRVLKEVCTRTVSFRCTVQCGLVDRYHLPVHGGSWVLRNRLYP